MTAAQSACTPDRAALVTAMLSRLDRQSTRVPNTSNSSTRGGFTRPVSQAGRGPARAWPSAGARAAEGRPRLAAAGRAPAAAPRSGRLLPDPGGHELVEDRQRDCAAAEDRAVEAADVKPAAQLAGRKVTQPPDLPAPDEVRQGLSRPRDVAVDLVGHVGPGRGRVIPHEVGRLRP